MKGMGPASRELVEERRSAGVGEGQESWRVGCGGG